MITDAVIGDVQKVRGSKDTIRVFACLEASGTSREIEFVVDLAKMGLSWKGEFEMTLAKLLKQDFRSFYLEHHAFPCEADIAKFLQKHDCFTINKRNVENYQVFHYEA